MTLNEASTFFKIPLAVLLHLKKKGFLHNPLEIDEISNISFFRYIWKDNFILRSALSRLSIKERTKFIEQANLTKPEAYVLNRYLNANSKLHLKQIASELQHYYKLPMGVAIEITKRMRQKAYKSRWGKKKQER